jgi:hypothetical protein
LVFQSINVSVLADKREKLTPEKSMEILQKNGICLSLKEAEKVIEFMYEMANLAINKYLDDEDSKFIHPGKYR